MLSQITVAVIAMPALIQHVFLNADRVQYIVYQKPPTYHTRLSSSVANTATTSTPRRNFIVYQPSSHASLTFFGVARHAANGWPTSGLPPMAGLVVVLNNTHNNCINATRSLPDCGGQPIQNDHRTHHAWPS